jgi:hypothetical protein
MTRHSLEVAAYRHDVIRGILIASVHAMPEWVYAYAERVLYSIRLIAARYRGLALRPGPRRLARWVGRGSGVNGARLRRVPRERNAEHPRSDYAGAGIGGSDVTACATGLPRCASRTPCGPTVAQLPPTRKPALAPRRSCGRSLRRRTNAGGISLERLVGDTVARRDLLCNHSGAKAYVAGFSFGASLGAMAAQRPDLVSMVRWWSPADVSITAAFNTQLKGERSPQGIELAR